MCPTRKIENDFEIKDRNRNHFYASSLINALTILNEINDPLIENLSMLHKAAKYGDKNLIDYYIKEENYDVNLKCGRKQMTPLHIAAMVSNNETVKALLDNGADPRPESKIDQMIPLQYIGFSRLFKACNKRMIIRQNYLSHFELIENLNENSDQLCVNILKRKTI